MSIFNNKVLVKIISIICIFLILTNVGTPSRVYAEDDEQVWGGILLRPVTKLLTGIGDGIIDIIHSSLLGQTETLIKLDGTASDWWGNHGAKVIGWMDAEKEKFIPTATSMLTENVSVKSTKTEVFG